MEVFTRERLQAYKDVMLKKRATAFVQRYYQAILHAADVGHTSYFIDINPNNGPSALQMARTNVEQPPEPTIDDIINGFREQFPGCTIEYTELWVPLPPTKYQAQTQVLKKGISIDWS